MGAAVLDPGGQVGGAGASSFGHLQTTIARYGGLSGRLGQWRSAHVPVGERHPRTGMRGVRPPGRRGPLDTPVRVLSIRPTALTDVKRLEQVMLSTQATQIGDKSLIRPSPVGSFGLKGFHREPTVFWCCGPGYGVCSGSVNRL